jgi:bifunctional UDP-N-acetylglucosamine pyrophosphorylase/glucosamine-1-phosphate N-acetyltransferase
MAAARGSLTVLVLAAGKGTRLRSKTIKLLHSVAGRPMVGWVLEAAAALKPTRTVTVVGYQADAVREALGDAGGRFVLQKEQRGTGHAVLQASRAVGGDGGPLLILNGDLPTLRTKTLRRLVQAHSRSGAALTVLSAEIADATGYGRVIRDAKGQVERIVEHRDANAAQRAVREINTGVYVGDTKKLLAILRKLKPDNDQGEYYLTDAVHELLARGEKVGAVMHGDAEELLGVNTREELAQSARTLYARRAAELQERGVTLLDATRTWIDPRAKVGRDTIIYPDVYIEGESKIGEDCIIRSGSRIVNSTIGKGSEIKDHCLLLDSRVGKAAAVGPFAHLRPGSDLGDETKVGNFVETKKATFGRGAKASHLSYIGDASVGPNCNIGAGTITCNYDGTNKFRTELAEGVFIGSDTQLVAPVKLGKGAYVGAGSTITADVPAGALAISRTKQHNIEGWVERANAKKKKKKTKKRS